jgi:hypothetical protein
MGVKPGHRQVGTALTTVENPYYSPDHPESESNPRHVTAVVNLRESSVVTLAALHILDADQVAAAFRFRHAWETVESARQASIGFEEWIDAGRLPAGIAERQLKAAGDLRQCRKLLGAHGYMLVGRVCGEGWHIRDLYPNRRARQTATDMLRIHLSSLAALWH